MKTLRPYQERAVAAVCATLPTGPTILVAPTGSGKTVCLTEIVRRLRRSCLWIVHRRELAAQAQKHLRGLALVETVQGLLARGERPPADLIVYDEVPFFLADLWQTVRDAYPHAWQLGATATPTRRDGRPLGDLFTHLIVGATYSELIREGHIVPARVYCPEQALMKGIALRPEDAYTKYAPGSRALIFVDRVERAEQVAEHLRAQGVSAACLSDKTPAGRRRQLLHDFEHERLRVIVNCLLLTVGTDLPCTQTIVLARQVSHPSIYIQTVGRGLRPYPGKQHCTVLDLVGAALRFGLPHADREYSLAGEAITLSQSVPPVRTCLQCGAVHGGSPTACSLCGYVWPIAPVPTIKIWDAELAELYDGEHTVESAKHREWARLLDVSAQKSLPLSWATKEYEKLFHDRPPMHLVSDARRREEWDRLRRQAVQRGYKPGWAAHRFKSIFGVWPSGRAA